jgi:diguanylate cyclase (GGDEF)-like protein
MTDRHSRNPAVTAALLAALFALGKLSLRAAGFNGAAAAIWPPSGFAVAALIMLGRSLWPAVFGGTWLVYLSATGQVVPSLLIAIGSTLEGLVGAALVGRAAAGVAVFRRADTIFRFTAISGLCSTPISATFGAAAMMLLGTSGWSELAYFWMIWWLANFTGLLVVAPFTILWTTTPFRPIHWRQAFEGVLLVVLLAMVCLVVFGGRFPSDVQNYPLEFLCVPFLLWSAFRFGRRETITVVLTMSAVAVWGTLHGFGPFVRETQNESLVLVQAYISVISVTGLVLASAVAEHQAAQQQLRELATTDSLTGLVNYRRLLEVLRAEIARSQRTKRAFALVFVDMNGLKKINDKYGHLAGSRAICRVADALRKSCRTIDTPARYGGDEFAVVLAETGEEGARLVLQRVSDRLAADPDRPALSVSGGLAIFPRDGDTPTLLIRAADQALYAAKAATSAARRSATVPPERRTGTLF